MLRDADGRALIEVVGACDAWFAGLDPDGVFVTIHRETGEVRWHAAYDTGSDAVSELGPEVATPLSFDGR